MELPYGSNSSTGHLPRENENTNQKDTCISMFIETLFILVKLWKQLSIGLLLKCPSIDELVKKV